MRPFKCKDELHKVKIPRVIEKGGSICLRDKTQVRERGSNLSDNLCLERIYPNVSIIVSHSVDILKTVIVRLSMHKNLDFTSFQVTAGSGWSRIPYS